MKNFWEKFISNKFNIVLAIIEFLALVSWGLMYALSIFVYFFILLQASFFVVWGVKVIKDSNKILIRADQYADLPMTSEEKMYYRKKDLQEYKSTRSRAVMLIVIGGVLLILLFSM